MSKNTALKSAAAVAIEFRTAFDAAASTHRELMAIRWPDPICLTVPEIGPGCKVRDLDQLRDAVAAHITNTDMPMFQHEFRKRMASYTQALQLLQTRYDEWRALAGVDGIERREAEAYDLREKAWKGFLAWANSHPRDIPTLANALHDRETLEPWRFRQFLELAGKGVRP
jgi:hypothetical protein